MASSPLRLAVARASAAVAEAAPGTPASTRPKAGGGRGSPGTGAWACDRGFLSSRRFPRAPAPPPPHELLPGPLPTPYCSVHSPFPAPHARFWCVRHTGFPRSVHCVHDAPCRTAAVGGPRPCRLFSAPPNGAPAGTSAAVTVAQRAFCLPRAGSCTVGNDSGCRVARWSHGLWAWRVVARTGREYRYGPLLPAAIAAYQRRSTHRIRVEQGKQLL
jgi:hypothetical protein